MIHLTSLLVDFDIVVDLTDDTRTVSVTGDLDANTARQLAELLDHLVAGGGTVLVNLDGVTFMDAAGIGALVHCAHRLAPAGELRIVAASPVAARVIDLTGTGAVLRLDGVSASPGEPGPGTGR
ncbi:MAG: STAS domain-containing protein [Actinobacteria bacterium]|nr:STAS domain-containing protein [Actinomycetota bacterium]